MQNLEMYPYFYQKESEQFAFFRIPKLLMTEKEFQNLSIEAKILYGLLLDRMELSRKNRWVDEKGRVYIYYTLKEVMKNIGCGHNKATRLFVELDVETGIGLIMRIRTGQGKPAIIYVMNFLEVQQALCQSAQNGQSRMPEQGSLECSKEAGNYTDINHTEISETPFILEYDLPMIERMKIIKKVIRHNISYEVLKNQYGSERLDNLVDLMVEVEISTKPTIRIAGEERPLEVVKSQFMKLNASHIEIVFRGLDNNTTEIRNMKSYLLTSLYNAPFIANQYYSSWVQHDMYGDSS